MHESFRQEIAHTIKAELKLEFPNVPGEKLTFLFESLLLLAKEIDEPSYESANLILKGWNEFSIKHGYEVFDNVRNILNNETRILFEEKKPNLRSYILESDPDILAAELIESISTKPYYTQVYKDVISSNEVYELTTKSLQLIKRFCVLLGLPAEALLNNVNPSTSERFLKATRDISAEL